VTARTILALLVLLVAPSAASPAHAQGEGWTVESFDVEVVVDPGDAALVVIEEITVDFGGLERRGILRTIPYRYRYDDEHDRLLRLSGWDVQTGSGTPGQTQVTEERDTVTLRIGDPDIRIRGRHTYRIAYRVEGALNSFDTHEELFWNATGHGWDVPIREATVRVVGAPILDVLCFSGPFGSTRPCDAARLQGAQADFVGEGLGPGHGLTVVAAFEPGSVNVPGPILEQRWALQRALMGSPAAMPLTVVGALFAFLGLAWLVIREGRDRVLRGGLTVDGRVDADAVTRRPLVNRPAVPVQYRPPDGLRPGQLGVLVDERVDPVDMSATIVDLAVRGYLRIVEETSRSLRSLWRSRSEWTFVKQTPPPDDTLLAYERELLDALFRDRDEVALSDLTGEFHKDYAEVRRLMYTDAVDRGWFTRSPKTTRTIWLGVGVLATILSVALLAGLLVVSTFALAATPLVLASLGLTVAHRWMPHRTPKGSRRLAETIGFRDFILTAESDRARFAEEENIFIAYLPYAVVFGATDKWARAFADLGRDVSAEVGRFYVADGMVPDLSRLSSGLSDLSATAGTGS
jgi:hypothetical protein